MRKQRRSRKQKTWDERQHRGELAEKTPEESAKKCFRRKPYCTPTVDIHHNVCGGDEK